MERNKTKPTIAFYSNPSSLGGSEVYLERLFQAFPFDQYNVLFFCSGSHPLISSLPRSIKPVFLTPQEESKKVDRGHKPSIEQTRKNGWNKKMRSAIPNSFKLLLGTIKETMRLKTMFQKYEIDLIHFNDTGCEPPVIAARLSGIKHVTGTYHVVPSEEKEDCSWVHQLIEYWSTRSLQAAISVSEATKQAWMKRTGVAGQTIRVVYNGIDFDQPLFKQVPDVQSCRDEFHLSEEDKIVVVPARLHPMKGHCHLIRAMKEIVLVHPNLKFLFVGDGPLEETLKQECESLQVQYAVRFCGFRKDILMLMKWADLIVLPSVALEALPFALIESHACGKAIVASDFSGIPEIVQNNKTGFLVQPGDSKGLAAAIIEIMNDDEKRLQMGNAGREHIEKSFSLDQMLSKTFGFFHELLESS